MPEHIQYFPIKISLDEFGKNSPEGFDLDEQIQRNNLNYDLEIQLEGNIEREILKLSLFFKLMTKEYDSGESITITFIRTTGEFHIPNLSNILDESENNDLPKEFKDHLVNLHINHSRGIQGANLSGTSLQSALIPFEDSEDLEYSESIS